MARQIALVYYTSPALVPSGLKRVAVVSGTAPNSVQRVSPVVLASPDLAPAGLKLYGAISYASLDLVPSGLQVLALDDYQARVLATGPILYLPMDEGLGAVAVDKSGNSRNGAYTGVLWGNQSPVAGKDCPLFDGATSYATFYSASLAAAFNGAEGTAMLWAKVSAAGIWADGLEHFVYRLGADDNNTRRIEIAGGNWVCHTTNGGVVKDVVVSAGGALGWLPLVTTWSSSADAVKFYVAGTQVGTTQTGLGVYAGTLTANLCTVGAYTQTPILAWSGLIDNFALWTRALSPAEVSSLAVAS